MEQSVKVLPNVQTVLDASPSAAGPGKSNCLTQLAHVHRLKNSEEKYNDHQFNQSMFILRKEVGLGTPLKIGMELHAARQIKRLPFLQSSNIMEDVLLGRDEEISFSDYLGVPENCEQMRNPHVMVEKAWRIL